MKYPKQPKFKVNLDREGGYRYDESTRWIEEGIRLERKYKQQKVVFAFVFATILLVGMVILYLEARREFL